MMTICFGGDVTSGLWDAVIWPEIITNCDDAGNYLKTTASYRSKSVSAKTRSVQTHPIISVIQNNYIRVADFRWRSQKAEQIYSEKSREILRAVEWGPVNGVIAKPLLSKQVQRIEPASQPKTSLEAVWLERGRGLLINIKKFELSWRWQCS